jgi:excisionase family DNA binding protein
MKDLISAEEAARLLSVSKRWLIELINRGLIEAQKVGSVWVVSKQSVLDYLKQRQN